MKTGGGEIEDEMYLTSQEQSMLDYVGVEGVVGKWRNRLPIITTLSFLLVQSDIYLA